MIHSNFSLFLLTRSILHGYFNPLVFGINGIFSAHGSPGLCDNLEELGINFDSEELELFLVDGYKMGFSVV